MEQDILNITSHKNIKDYSRQISMFHVMRNIPETGMEVDYLGINLAVNRNVFIPCEDSWGLSQLIIPKMSESILDVGTGCGNVSIALAKKGASKIIAIDWNKAALANCNFNIDRHGLGNIISTKYSDIFSNLIDEKFDIIVANLPFMNYVANDVVESSIWDTDLKTNKRFLNEVRNHLSVNGRAYFTQANFGSLCELRNYAKGLGIDFKIIGEQKGVSNPESIFYTFELVFK